MENYKQDKDSLVKWLGGIASAVVIIILTGIYTQLKSLNDFMIRSQLKIEFLEKTDMEHDKSIERLNGAVFLKPKDVKIEHE
jgi:hypothetical protein